MFHSDGSSVRATDSLHLQGDATGNHIFLTLLFPVSELNLFSADVHLLNKNIK